MQLRRLRSHRLSLLAAGTLLASPLLAGCGFNYATDRVNTISAGVNDREGDVDVLGAVVIAGQDNAGLFVATLVNKDSEAVDLEGVQETAEIQPIGSEAAVTIEPGAGESLFQTGGLAIGGEFRAGDFVPVTLTFSNGQVTTVEVSVVPPCYQYSLDKLTELTLPEAASDTPIDPGTGTEAPAPEEEGAEEGEPTADEARYSCEPLEAIEGHSDEEGAEGEGTEGESTAPEGSE